MGSAAQAHDIPRGQAVAATAPQEAAQGENPWFIAAAVMLATFMEVLDTSIASVALPYIAGSLSASNDEATWVLTSYLVSNAIVLPASNWCSLKFGRKRFLMTCVTIFTISSFLCGAAPTLAFMLIARVIQGAGGGAFRGAPRGPPHWILPATAPPLTPPRKSGEGNSRRMAIERALSERR